MNKLTQKLIMYYEIHRLRRKGFKPAQIGRYLVLDYRTVKKYLTMKEEEYLEFTEGQPERKKLKLIFALATLTCYTYSQNVYQRISNKSIYEFM